jgi:hypothetical protein
VTARDMQRLLVALPNNKVMYACNGVRLPVDRVFSDVFCGAAIVFVNAFHEEINKNVIVARCKTTNRVDR